MSNGFLIDKGITRLVSSTPEKATVNQGCTFPEVLQIDLLRKEAVQEARKNMQSELDADRKRQAELWASMEESFSRYLSGAETQMREQIVKLSVKVAEIILRRQLPDKDMITDVVKEILEPVMELEGVKVRLHAGEAEAVQAAKENGSLNGIGDKIEVVSDVSLAAGDVMIESRGGQYDGRISQRLELLEERLLERVKNDNAE